MFDDLIILAAIAIAAHPDRVGFESVGEFRVRRSPLLAWVRDVGQDWYDDQPTFHIGETAGGRSRVAGT